MIACVLRYLHEGGRERISQKDDIATEVYSASARCTHSSWWVGFVAVSPTLSSYSDCVCTCVLCVHVCVCVCVCVVCVWCVCVYGVHVQIVRVKSVLKVSSCCIC